MTVASDPARAAEPKLPRPPTPFIGRKRLLTVLRDLFASGERLVTLTGPAGIGKTRLALELARTRASSFAGGALFCDLSEHRRDADLEDALLAALGAESSADPAEVLSRRGRVLVVLDNVEQLLPSAADRIGAWRDRCTDVVWVVTSRERLHVPGEVLVEVPALELPQGDDDASAEAMQLWAERRRRLDPDWLLSAEEAATVRRILRELDGNPLAIELAAARASLLGPEELLARLDRRFEVLAHGPRGASARHASMQAAIAWSWDLLEPWERTALAQCAVFRGGFDVEAAEAVLDLSAHAAAPPILDVLQALRDKCLLRTSDDAGAAARIEPYRLVRELAADRLAERDDAEDARARHHAFYAALGERLRDAMDGPGGDRALDRLERERENLLAVVETGSGDGATPEEVEQALAALIALDGVLWTRGPVGSHLAHLDRVLARAEALGLESPMRARALVARGLSRARVGRVEQGVADGERAVSLAERIGDPVVTAAVLLDLSWLRWRTRDTDAMEEALERARALALEAGDRRLEGMITGAFGAAAKQRGDYEHADALYREALAIHREVGNERFEGQARTRRAVLYLEQGRLDEVREDAEAALAIHRRFGDRYVEGLVLTVLGAIHHAEERLDEARATYENVIEIQDHIGERRLSGASLGYLGIAEFESGDIERATEHLHQARRVLRDAGEPRHAALFLAFLAGIEASLGHTERAEQRLEAADELIIAHPDLAAEAVLELQRGHIDLARARDATSPEAEQDHLARARRRLGVATRPDDAGRSPAALSVDVRIAARILERELDAHVRADAADEEALLVHPFGHWFRPPGGEPVDCRRRQALRRLLVRLTHQRLHRPSAPLSAEALVASGWPDEKMSADSAQNRLYVTLNRLRDLGLRGVLHATGEGYLLDPECPTRFVSLLDEP